MDPDTFHQLDKVIHEKGRMAIMSLLAARRDWSFSELKEALGMTDGNLTTHMKTLQKAGFVAITKSFHSGRSLTTCSLTEAGRDAFSKHLDLLEQILRAHRPTPE